jgi:hypothetical protein
MAPALKGFLENLMKKPAPLNYRCEEMTDPVMREICEDAERIMAEHREIERRRRFSWKFGPLIQTPEDEKLLGFLFLTLIFPGPLFLAMFLASANHDGNLIGYGLLPFIAVLALIGIGSWFETFGRRTPGQRVLLVLYTVLVPVVLIGMPITGIELSWAMGWVK